MFYSFFSTQKICPDTTTEYDKQPLADLISNQPSQQMERSTAFKILPQNCSRSKSYNLNELTKIDPNKPPPEEAIISSDYGTLVPNLFIDTIVSYYNNFGRLRNEDKFSPQNIDNVFQIIVGDSENNIYYFEHMLEYLKKVDGIESTLLVISHDGISEKLLEIVENIDFCLVKQLFFPGGKIYTNRFPGPDNSLEDVPDSFGNPRKWKFPGVRHHFWWAINSVFKMKELSNFDKDICFLDGDYFVTPDIIKTIKKLESRRIGSCPKCFGTFLQRIEKKMTPSFLRKSNNIVNTFEATGGLCFNRTMFFQWKNNAHEWCSFDDYNYDFALKNLKRNKVILNDFISVHPPRIWHAGRCGFHQKGNCKINEAEKELFDQYCNKIKPIDDNTPYANTRARLPPQAKFGGFSHPKDYEFCMKTAEW